jgi:hypothetical protein
MGDPLRHRLFERKSHLPTCFMEAHSQFELHERENDHNLNASLFPDQFRTKKKHNILASAVHL